MRANYEDLARGIYRTEQFLIRFLSNLLLQTQLPLRNRDMLVGADSSAASQVNESGETAYDTVKWVGDTVNDTVNLLRNTPNHTILRLLQQNNQLTAVELSSRLGLSLSTVKRNIRALKNSGKLERLGSDKKGYWRVIG